MPQASVNSGGGDFEEEYFSRGINGEMGIEERQPDRDSSLEDKSARIVG